MTTKSNGWIVSLAAATLLLIVTPTVGVAQQGMMHGRMHADTTPAAAQCPGGGGMSMMGMMQGRGMMGMMGAGPSVLLAQRDVLGLDDDQVARLEALREEQQGMTEGMHRGMMAVRGQMQHVMAADSLDLEAYRSALEDMADQMVGHHMQMARFHERVQAVLTPEQREKVRTGMRMMRHMMGSRSSEDPGR